MPNATEEVLTTTTLDVTGHHWSWRCAFLTESVLMSPVNVSYVMQAFDSGGSQWVWWTTADPTLTPGPGDTSPNYSGSLSATRIARKLMLR